MMLRTALLVIAWLALGPALAQEDAADAGTDADEPAATEQPAETPEADEDESAAAEVGDQSYLDIDEEDFRPSEEIPTDQSITFPTDI